MQKLSYGWVAILMFGLLAFTGCDDDDDRPDVPVIGTIADNIATDSRFSTLAAALERTGLDAALDNFTARLTVFAPTDEAFAAAGIDLSAVSDEALADILRYHVIGGENLVASAIPDGTSSLTTLNTTGSEGNALTLSVNNAGGTITINTVADVTIPNLEYVNGTVHGIDAVLLPPTIVDQAVRNGSFTTLVSLLQRVGLDEVLSGEGDFTVFAPTDDAFTASGIDAGALSDDDIRNLLLYHVVGTGIPAGSVGGGDNFVTSLSESGPDDEALTLLANQTDGNVTVNGDAAVVVADVFASNGTVHAVDQVLMPQSIVDFVVNAEGVSELEAAVVAADLVGALSGDGPLTVFGPVNAAFEAIADTASTLSAARLGAILQAHVVSGNITSDELSEAMVGTLNADYDINIRINPGEEADSEDDDFFEIATSDSTAVQFILTDIQGSNGVIHLIDGVLLPENF